MFSQTAADSYVSAALTNIARKHELKRVAKRVHRTEKCVGSATPVYGSGLDEDISKADEDHEDELPPPKIFEEDEDDLDTIVERATRVRYGNAAPGDAAARSSSSRAASSSSRAGERSRAPSSSSSGERFVLNNDFRFGGQSGPGMRKRSENNSAPTGLDEDFEFLVTESRKHQNEKRFRDNSSVGTGGVSHMSGSSSPPEGACSSSAPSPAGMLLPNNLSIPAEDRALQVIPFSSPFAAAQLSVPTAYGTMELSSPRIFATAQTSKERGLVLSSLLARSGSAPLLSGDKLLGNHKSLFRPSARTTPSSPVRFKVSSQGGAASSSAAQSVPSSSVPGSIPHSPAPSSGPTRLLIDSDFEGSTSSSDSDVPGGKHPSAYNYLTDMGLFALHMNRPPPPDPQELGGTQCLQAAIIFKSKIDPQQRFLNMMNMKADVRGKVRRGEMVLGREPETAILGIASERYLPDEALADSINFMLQCNKDIFGNIVKFM